MTGLDTGTAPQSRPSPAELAARHAAWLREGRIAALRHGEVFASHCRTAVTQGESAFGHAHRHACHCANCHRPLTSDEPVWRRKIGPVGACCADLPRRYPEGALLDTAVSCTGCGRPVHIRRKTTTPACSQRCESRHYRAARRVRFFRCASCGRNGYVAAGRADRRYCSSACRQRAYRRRVVPPPLITCGRCGTEPTRQRPLSRLTQDSPFLCAQCWSAVGAEAVR